MAQPTNTFDTYDSVNAMREDLADVIYNIAPTETPFMSNASKGSATNTLHQWNTDAFRNPRPLVGFRYGMIPKHISNVNPFSHKCFSFCSYR